MTDSIAKLNKDLDILQAMVEELTNYLNSEVLYWPMFKANYPKMTMGGYFMRQRRLQGLSYLLSDSKQVELKHIANQFNEMTFDKKALLMKKGTEELRTRVNQWKEHLQEYWDSEVIEKQYFATDVEVRTTITDLIFELGINLSQVDKDLLFQIDALDHDLRANWREGDFIWPDEWVPAYGKGDYWWLYGTPRIPENN
jgi:nicotinamide mononucleotide adenylyltransferase